MISDVLSDAVAEIDRYLRTGIYSGPIRQRIEDLRDYMDDIRRELDTPPTRDA